MADKVDHLHARGVDGIIRGLDEHYDSMEDVRQDPYGAWLAIQNLWSERDAAYKRGLEDAAKIVDYHASICTDMHDRLFLGSVAGPIRAKIKGKRE